MTKAPGKPKRSAGRPSRYTRALGEKICELIATGSTLRAAAKSCGVGWRTVARWNVKHPEFRQGYALARAARTTVWAEECIEIVDNTKGDYVRNPKTGKLELNRENVLRAKLRVDERHWQMARLDPRLWSDRQQIEVKDDWSRMTIEERERRALALLDKARTVVAQRKELEAIRRGEEEPIVYDATDADELAEAAARAAKNGDPKGRR